MSVKGRAILLTALLLALPGCGDSSPSPEKAAPPTASTTTAAPAVPTDFVEYLSWATNELRSIKPAPAAPPTDAVFPSPKWPVERLDGVRLRRADKDCSWEAEAAKPHVLLELGPFKSTDENSAGFIRATQRRLKRELLKLWFGDFEVQREQVGVVEIEMLVPFGKQVEVWWDGGYTILPVATHTEMFTFRLATSGATGWKGPLTELYLVFDGMDDKPVEIKRIAFLSRADDFPEATGSLRAKLGTDLRSAVYAHAPARLMYQNVQLPPNARLQMGLGVVPRTEGSATPCMFKARVIAGEQSTDVLDESIAPSREWTDKTVDLSPWAGQNVTIELEAASDAAGDVALWANPTIYQPVENAPFVILYLIDALSSEHIDLYGAPRETMPNLAKLAGRGVWFPDMISNSARTLESIPDLFLSMPTERSGVRNDFTVAHPALVRLAEVLQAAGYATASFVTNDYAGPRMRMDEGFDCFIDEVQSVVAAKRRDVEEADRTVPIEALTHFTQQHHDRPMFLYVHTAEPHGPYTPRAEYAQRYATGYQGPVDGTYDPETGFNALKNPRIHADAVAHVASLYDAEVNYADARLGMMIDALDRDGFAERMNLIVVGDHGEEFQQHGHWEHGYDMHNETTRVPLVAAGPLLAERGAVDAPAQIMDVMPTILDLCGLPEPYELSGTSLAPLVRRDAASPTDADMTAWRTRMRFGSNHTNEKRGFVEYELVDGKRWKLLFSARPWKIYEQGPLSNFLLFDLEHDPLERVNVIYGNQGVARRLIDALLQWRAAQHMYTAGQTEALDLDTLKQLEALGYVGGAGDDEQEGND